MHSSRPIGACTTLTPVASSAKQHRLPHCLGPTILRYRRPAAARNSALFVSPRLGPPMRYALLALVVAVALLASSGSAWAFCGFYVSGANDALYNDATQVVLMREGKRTVLSMENNYAGPAEDFAMVVPVPVVLEEEDVKTLPATIFRAVDRMASPRLVEYWEQDPCAPPYPEYDELPRPSSVDMSRSVEDESSGEELVTVEAEFSVGEYDIVILSARESTALDRWLQQNGYNIPKGAAAVLQPYVEQGLYFFVAKVDVEKVTFEDGRARLSPLRVHYDTDTFSLPIRLGMLNAKGDQDLIVHILAQNQRYQVVNYKNVTIPTNLGVSDDTKNRFGEFYAALFDRTLSKNPGSVVTEYSWDAGSCDPCPGPVLGQEHFLTLGADVLPSGNSYNFVLTRLHARYSRATLGEDLVFGAAPPILGGREHVIGEHGELEEGATPGSQNNFQGRYIIRHAWEGAIECENPQRGIWGGPPGGGSGVTPGEDTAFAPRGELELAAYVTQPVPEIELTATELAAVKNTEPLPVGPYVGPQPGVTCASCSVHTPASASALLVGVAVCLLGLVVLRRRN